jgi:hypothetical protein
MVTLIQMAIGPNTVERILRRLRRDRPDLAGKVIAGEISARRDAAASYSRE